MSNDWAKRSDLERLEAIVSRLATTILEDRQETLRLRKEEDKRGKEAERRGKEAERRGKEADERLARQVRLFEEYKVKEEIKMDNFRKELHGVGRKIGSIAESLLVGDIVETLQKIAPDLTELQADSRGVYKGNNFQIDGYVYGQKTAVVIEAKTTLHQNKIDDFITDTLAHFTGMRPEHEGKKIYGAIAYLEASEAAKDYAQQQGLLVIRSTHQNKELINPEGFQPRDFHP